MAYSVTALVRRARLPRSLGSSRPTAKLCLLALADRCDENGLGAWPSLATIAKETEVDDTRTIAARLRSLEKLGLIYEQEPPRQRKPRTWALNLAAIDALAQRLPLIDDPRPSTPCTPDEPPAPPEVQLELLGPQDFRPDPQAAAPDPVPLDPVNLNPSKHGNKGDMASARVVVAEVLTGLSERPAWTEVLARAEALCRDRGVDLGDPDEHVLARACVLEQFQARFKVASSTLPHIVARSAR